MTHPDPCIGVDFEPASGDHGVKARRVERAQRVLSVGKANQVHPDDWALALAKLRGVREPWKLGFSRMGGYDIGSESNKVDRPVDPRGGCTSCPKLICTRQTKGLTA